MDIETFFAVVIASLLTGMISVAVLKMISRSSKAAEQRKFEQDRIRKKEAPAYSNEILDFVKTFTAQIAALKFRSFIDSRDLSKVTKEQTKKLVDEVARTVKDHLETSKIEQDSLIFSMTFLDKYIVDLSVTAVKDLLRRAVAESNIDE